MNYDVTYLQLYSGTMRSIYFVLWIVFLGFPLTIGASVSPGIDVLIDGPKLGELKGKSIGLVTNHTAISRNLEHTLDLLLSKEKKVGYTIKALFAPEHGLFGGQHNSEEVKNSVIKQGIPVYSLYGTAKRPTDAMLKGIDLIIYDIQDIGSRAYTYTTTMFYVIEEAAKRGIEVLILDRPNPMGGEIVDGPMLDSSLRSMVGYINVPYCHGMTVGELATFFNEEYHIHCKLQVIKMEGWKRGMLFTDTGLSWVPTSPQIPEASTPLYYPMTGILGELSLVNIGVGYTLPFKIVGAPWIDGMDFAKHLNAEEFPGVHFEPFSFKPFFGKFSGEECQGAMIIIRDPSKIQPVRIQFLIMGILKKLYPKRFLEALEENKERRAMFDKVSGNKEIYEILQKKPLVIWPLIGFQQKERSLFLEKRKTVLFKEYQ